MAIRKDQRGRGGPKKGAYSQRELVKILKPIIDAAAGGVSSAHRDIARSKLRTILGAAKWNTAYVLNNLGPTRTKWLRAHGYPADARFTYSDAWEQRSLETRTKEREP